MAINSVNPLRPGLTSIPGRSTSLGYATKPSVANYGGTGSIKSLVSGSSASRSSAPVYNPAPVPTAPPYTPPPLVPVPEYVPPKYKGLPTYAAPTWDEGEISSLAQRRAAPGLRALRWQIQNVTRQRYDNPQVGRMTLRDALQGYGTGIGQIIGAAGSAAAGEYGQKYARTSENARSAYASKAASIADENRYAADLAKTKYTGALTDRDTRNRAAETAAERRYAGSMDEWSARNTATQNAATLSNQEKAEEARQKNTYALQQQGFEDAWERWKKQQSESVVIQKPRVQGGNIPVMGRA